MTQDQDEQLTRIKHYKRTHSRAQAKELVSEEVKVGSATFTFLQKMEEKRLSRECMRIIDMRNLVEGECNSYVFRDRTMWMDAKSYAIFLEGLKQDKGVFTVSTYERIINAPHTYKRQRAQRAQTEREARQTAAQSTDTTTVASSSRQAAFNAYQSQGTASKNKDIGQYEIIPLGYFRKRLDSRLRRIENISITHGAITRKSKTSDLSISGLLVKTTDDFCPPAGTFVLVDCDFLKSYSRRNVEALSYRVVRVDQSAGDTFLALALDPPQDNPSTRMLGQFIEKQLSSGRRAQRLEMTDAILTATSLLAERYYIQSTYTLPFFLSRDDSGGINLQAVCVNSTNLRLLKSFESRAGRFDLRGLNIPERLNHFLETGYDEGRNSSLVAVYRDKAQNRPRVIADFEFEHYQDWLYFLGQHRKDEHFVVFKVLLRSVNQPDPQRVQRSIDRLAQKSLDEAEKIILQSHGYLAAGNLVDVSDEVRKMPQHSLAMRGSQDSLPPQELPFQGRSQPELLGMGYVERHRREDRYQHALKVVVHKGQQTSETLTRDISVHGLSLTLPNNDLNAKIDDKLTISFTELERGGSLLDVFRTKNHEADYLVVGVNAGARPLVRMKVVQNEKSKRLAERILELINSQRDPLNPDLSEFIRAAKSRYYAELVTESSATLPVFMYKDKETSTLQLRFGVPEVPSAVTSFFELSEGQMDFNPINHAERLNYIYNTLKKQTSASLAILMYKEKIPGEARFRIHSLADFELQDDGTGRQFLEGAYEHDYCFIKLFLSRPHAPPVFEVDQILDELKAYSHAHASKMAQEFDSLVAVGDIMDLTRQISEMLARRTGETRG
jgi:hypothetical protein